MTKKWKDIVKDIVKWYENNPNAIFFRDYLLPKGITLEEFNKNCTEGDIPKKYQKLYKLIYEYEEHRLIKSMNGLNEDNEVRQNAAKDYLQNYHGWKPKGRDNDSKDENIAELAQSIANEYREKERLKVKKEVEIDEEE